MRIIKKACTKPGDTMIEVMFAIAVFALVSVLSIMVMNSGVATAEASLELSMARNEIDAQSEAIRFIHNSFLSERKLLRDQRTYEGVWSRLKKFVNDYNSDAILPLNVDDCNERYSGPNQNNIYGRKTIILNTRQLDSTKQKEAIISADESADKFSTTPLSPRLLFGNSVSANNSDDTLNEKYTNLLKAQGIWIIPIRSQTVGLDSGKNYPEFYDFHIYACWNAPGRNRPTTIGTIIRLYNPELIEAAE